MNYELNTGAYHSITIKERLLEAVLYLFFTD